MAYNAIFLIENEGFNKKTNNKKQIKNEQRQNKSIVQMAPGIAICGWEQNVC